MAISKANKSLFPRGLPGASFARYIQQEVSKSEESNFDSANYVGVFNDVEAEVVKDIAYEPNYPWLEQRVRDILGGGMVSLRYRGTIDGRIPRPYPGPAREGSFWVVEWPGQIGSHQASAGDVLIRLSQFSSDWTLISKEDEGNLPLQTAQKIAQKHLRILKQDLKNRPGSKAPPAPKTKAAPGPQKRKIILEDEGEDE